jgi:hypothetical protein
VALGLASTVEVSVFDEQLVDLLEGIVASLRIEEVDDGHEGERRAHEDKIRLPFDTVDEHWGNHHNEELFLGVVRYALQPEGFGLNHLRSTSSARTLKWRHRVF